MPYKEKTRKGLFGRTVKVSKYKDDQGGKIKKRTVTREMNDGVKTKETIRAKNINKTNDTAKIKTRSFDSNKGVGFKYEKQRLKDRSGRKKTVSSRKYDLNVASGRSQRVGSESMITKDEMGKSATRSHVTTDPLKKRKVITWEGSPTSIKTTIKEAKSDIRQARKLSRGRANYGQ